MIESTQKYIDMEYLAELLGSVRGTDNVEDEVIPNLDTNEISVEVRHNTSEDSNEPIIVLPNPRQLLILGPYDTEPPPGLSDSEMEQIEMYIESMEKTENIRLSSILDGDHLNLRDHLSGVNHVSMVHLLESGGLQRTNQSSSNLLHYYIIEREHVFLAHLNNVWHWFTFRALITGSIPDGLRARPTVSNEQLVIATPEADFLLVLQSLIITDESWVEYSSTFQGFVEIVPPSLVSIEWQQYSNTCGRDYLVTNTNRQNCFNARQMAKDMNYMLMYGMSRDLSLRARGSCRVGCEASEVRELSTHGPATTALFNLGNTSIDYVMALECHFWPHVAQNWPNRKRCWPTQADVQLIITNGCHLVAKSPSLVNQTNIPVNTYWRFSFSIAENILMYRLQQDIPIAKQCIRFLKMLCGKYLECPNILTSYHFKTLVLWGVERIPMNAWCENNFTVCLIGLLDLLIHMIVNNFFPHYFIEDMNIIQGASRHHLVTLARQLSQIRKKPLKYFYLPQESLLIFGI